MAIALFLVFGLGLLAIAVATMAFGQAWFWRLRQWQRIAMMAGLGLVGSLGAWRAAVDAERVEPVWLDVGTGVKPLAIPIRVRMAPDLDTYADTARAALRLWNEQAGCRLFVEEAPESMAYDVRIVFLKGEPCGGVASDPGREVAASTYFCAGGGVDIAIQRLDEIQGAYVVFAHELGHVLGLAHDPIGLMAAAEAPMTLVLPSDKDTKAVRDRYCLGVR